MVHLTKRTLFIHKTQAYVHKMSVCTMEFPCISTGHIRYFERSNEEALGVYV